MSMDTTISDLARIDDALDATLGPIELRFAEVIVDRIEIVVNREGRKETKVRAILRDTGYQASGDATLGPNKIVCWGFIEAALGQLRYATRDAKPVWLPPNHRFAVLVSDRIDERSVVGIGRTYADAIFDAICVFDRQREAAQGDWENEHA